MKRVLALAMLLAACAGNGAAQTEAIEASYPEGPLYHEGRLYYAEMGADRISVVDDGAPRPFFSERGCGPTAIAPYSAGFIVLCHVGQRLVEVDLQGQPQRRWNSASDGVPLQDPNDASADGRGGVYFSDPGLFSRNTRPHGRLMYLAPDGALRIVADRLWYPNGVFVDRARNQLYVSEHMSEHVFRYDIRADGGIDGPDVFADISSIELPRRYAEAYRETGPDGIEMSAEGEVFIAIYGEGRILRFSREGRLLGMASTPARYVTNLAFAEDGGAATTGSFINDEPPFRGEVRFFPPGGLTRGQE